LGGPFHRDIPDQTQQANRNSFGRRSLGDVLLGRDAACCPVAGEKRMPPKVTRAKP
jgi:hypothetical protein